MKWYYLPFFLAWSFLGSTQAQDRGDVFDGKDYKKFSMFMEMYDSNGDGIDDCLKVTYDCNEDSLMDRIALFKLVMDHPRFEKREFNRFAFKVFRDKDYDGKFDNLLMDLDKNNTLETEIRKVEEIMRKV